MRVQQEPLGILEVRVLDIQAVQVQAVVQVVAIHKYSITTVGHLLVMLI